MWSVKPWSWYNYLGEKYTYRKKGVQTRTKGNQQSKDKFAKESKKVFGDSKEKFKITCIQIFFFLILDLHLLGAIIVQPLNYVYGHLIIWDSQNFRNKNMNKFKR